jgi:hypothetical protein
MACDPRGDLDIIPHARLMRDFVMGPSVADAIATWIPAR